MFCHAQPVLAVFFFFSLFLSFCFICHAGAAVCIIVAILFLFQGPAISTIYT